MLKAVIFDMDGVLIDSECLYDRFISETLSSYGTEVPEVHLRSFYGVPSPETWEELIKCYSPPLTVAEALAMEREFVDTMMYRGEISPMPHVFTLIKNLKDSGMKVAVASCNYRYRVSKLIEQHDKDGLIDVSVCGDDVEICKPAPDIFILTSKLLDIPPENCLVIEDAETGVIAAKAAGMKTALYIDTDSVRYGVYGADFLLHSFEGVTTEKLEKEFENLLD